MADLSAEQNDAITFITGIDDKGAVAKNTYFTWSVGDNLGKAWISKWNNDASGAIASPTSLAGSGGGTVTYAFGPDLSVQEQNAYKAAISLWSDVANISFKQADQLASANIRFENGEVGGGETFVPANGPTRTGEGITQIPTQHSPNTVGGQVSVGIDAPDQYFDSFSPNASWTLSTVTHETGHAIGLGHAGRYNGGGFDGQLNQYDTQQWSVMSYIAPDDPNQRYFNQGLSKGTNWNVLEISSGNTFHINAQTPMIDDILSAQRIYGASTSSTFAGGQTYGFNSNVAGLSGKFFDFTQNTNPVVTLYNRGTGNTLDVSGFSTDSTINLNPGTFSSASTSGTLFNNISIAYGTKIDKAVGGTGNDIFYTNTDGNVIDGGTGTDTVHFAGARSDYTVANASNGETLVVNKTTGTTDRLIGIEDLEFDAQPVCFTTGTRIAVLRRGHVSEVAVEALAVGDLALTAQGTARPIRWIGHRTIRAETGCIAAHQWPVRIRAGAFGRDDEGRALPARDLSLSPGHPVLVDGSAAHPEGVLVPIVCLINGTSIARRSVSTVTYWHVELDRHDILLAEGLPAESYIDGGDRAFFGQASDHALHDPDFVAPGWSARCRPVATDGALVERERRRLDIVFAAALEGDCLWSPVETIWTSA